ncbi:MAG: hypothetical protein ABI230_09645 [Aestuariivirga sp.]
MVGDQWTYDLTDEITNTPTATVTYSITDISNKETTIAVTKLGGSGTWLEVYDESWGRKLNNTWKSVPNDGLSLKLPLAVGDHWSINGTDQNVVKGGAYRHLGTSKVLAEEKLGVPAGTYETFKVVSDEKWVGVNGQGQKGEIHAETWYAPEIDRIVKRTFKSKLEGHLLEQFEMVLTDNSPVGN